MYGGVWNFYAILHKESEGVTLGNLFALLFLLTDFHWSPFHLTVADTHVLASGPETGTLIYKRPDFRRPFPRSDQLSLCGSLGVPPALISKRATCAKTAWGCRQNDWQQISGRQRICRKSIICQHSPCMFGVVKRCAQTDSCVSMALQRGHSADSMVWYGKNKGFLQAIALLFKILTDWSAVRHAWTHKEENAAL